MKDGFTTMDISTKLISYLEVFIKQLHAHSAYLVDYTENTAITHLSVETEDTQQGNDDLIKQILESSTVNTSQSIIIEDIDEWLSSQNETHHISTNYSAYIIAVHHDIPGLYLAILSSSAFSINDEQKVMMGLVCENIFLQFSHQLKRHQNKSIITDDHFQLIFDSVPEAISFHELTNHKTIAVNKSFYDYTGYKAEEVIGKTGKDLNLWEHEHERQSYLKILSEKGFVSNFAAEFKMADNRIIHGLLSSNIIKTNNTSYILVIIRNIDDLKSTQKALEISEKKFRNVFNSIPDPVSIVKYDKSFAFTEVNNAFQDIIGKGHSNLIGKSGFDLNMWADKKESTYFLSQIRAHGFINNLQAKYRNSDGTVIEGLISAKTIDINQAPHLLIILKNIDNILKIKKALKTSEEKFRQIFNTSPDAININKIKNGVFVDVNPSFLEITGYSKEEIIGKPILDFGFWNQQKHSDQYIKQLRSKRDVNNLETTFLLKSGKIVHVLVSATVAELNGEMHIINTSRVIDDIKIMKQDLEESENKYRSIVENSHAGIVIINTEEEFTYVNKKAEEIFGYQAIELVGQKFEKVTHPSSLKLVKDNYRKRQQGEELPDKYEFKIITKDGNIKDIEINPSIHLAKSGEKNTIAQLLDITIQKRAVNTAYYEQHKLQQYLNIAPLILIALDKNENIEMVNNKACEVLGYAEDELLGRNWFDHFTPKESIKELRDSFHYIIDASQQVYTSENFIITKSGRQRRIHWQSTLIKDQHGNAKGLLSSGEDITERMNNLKILNQTKVVAILWKYEKKSEIHAVEYVSSNIIRLIGYTPEELINSSIDYLDLVHPNDKKRVLNEVDYYTKGGTFKHYSHDYYRLKCKDGNYIWVEDQTEVIRNSNGDITHLNGLLIDVSEKKKSLELIRESEERYRTIFNSNLDGLIIFNSKGEIVEANEVICNMYGFSLQELLNRSNETTIRIASELNISFVKEYLKKYNILVAESEDIRKSGEKFHINAKIRWITYNLEPHLLAIIRDISHLKTSEEELIKAKIKAEESDQLKSSFLANMSHEIRTPMNAIIGFSDLLLEEDISDDEKRNFISRIKNNGENLLNLINDIIDISKIEANQIKFLIEAIDIDKFLSSLYDLFELEAKKKNIFFKSVKPKGKNVYSISSDKSRLNQVMVNFISNALKFTPEKGTVEFGYYQHKIINHIVFYVKDSGIGIPLNEQKHVFDRFRQAHIMTHTDYGGTGLGLSISKGLIENLNGNIWFESEEGKGTQFFCSLPY